MSLKLCCLCTTTLGLLASYTIYMIYGIDCLVKYYHLNTECPDSYLWVYILISLIVSTSRTSAIIKVHKVDTPALLTYLVCLLLIDGSFAIWGADELFNTSCTPILSSKLWVYAYITFVIQIVMVSIYTFLCFCTIITACYHNYSLKEYTTLEEKYTITSGTGGSIGKYVIGV